MLEVLPKMVDLHVQYRIRSRNHLLKFNVVLACLASVMEVLFQNLNETNNGEAVGSNVDGFHVGTELARYLIQVSKARRSQPEDGA